MAKFSTEPKGMMQILKKEDILLIHENALNILEETGVRFDSQRALQLLEDKGCIVDHESHMVKFPRKLVNWAIEQAPEQFDMYNYAGDKVVELGKGNTYFGPGPGNPCILDGRNEKMTGKKKDLKTSYAIVQSSKMFSFATGSIVPDDCTGAEGADLYILHEALKMTDKPILAETWEEDSVDKVCQIIQEIRGSKEACIKKPFIILSACPVPPMKWEEKVIDVTFRCAEYGIPLLISSSPIMGVTAPVTFAGGVLQHTVENLSYVTFVQLIQPGSPVFYGGICGTMDMRTTYSSHSAVEACLCSAGFAAMAHYYGIPSLVFLCQSDSKLPDYQSGFETAMSGLTALLSGFDVVFGAGVVDSYNCTSNEKLIMDEALLGYIGMFSQGIQVDEELLAAEEIMEVGCGDEENHMQREFTMEWYRDYQHPGNKILDRPSYSNWIKDGRDLRKKAAEVLDRCDIDYSLGQDRDERIDQIFSQVLNK